MEVEDATTCPPFAGNAPCAKEEEEDDVGTAPMRDRGSSTEGAVNAIREDENIEVETRMVAESPGGRSSPPGSVQVADIEEEADVEEEREGSMWVDKKTGREEEAWAVVGFGERTEEDVSWLKEEEESSDVVAMGDVGSNPGEVCDNEQEDAQGEEAGERRVPKVAIFGATDDTVVAGRPGDLSPLGGLRRETTEEDACRLEGDKYSKPREAFDGGMKDERGEKAWAVDEEEEREVAVVDDEQVEEDA